MKMRGKIIGSFWVAILLCFTVALGKPVIGRAASDAGYEYILLEYGDAYANTEVSYDFSLDENTETAVVIIVPDRMTCDVKVYDSIGNLCVSETIMSTDWIAMEEEGMQMLVWGVDAGELSVGDYKLSLVFDMLTEYIIGVKADKPQPVLSQDTVTISEGCKKTLKVENTTEKITWDSTKKSVATVSSKGVITAKKAGTTTITATTESGQRLTCRVTVKTNVYKETKCTAKDVYYGDGVLQVYKASYASNGDLILKYRFINNCGYKVTNLEKIKIVVKTDTGKTIGTYSLKSKKVSVAQGESKDYSITIKKSKLKIKKADLRNATCTIDGEYIYWY